PLTIETAHGEVRAHPGSAKNPDLVLNGRAPLVAAVVLGKLDFNAATAAGMKSKGDPKILRRLQPPVQPQR
ncbi:MAG: transcriptional regulator, partial [Gammaproteobacteria bacterium]|nr:transcriptional regulator [Gammaproteobacteria bacterium]